MNKLFTNTIVLLFGVVLLHLPVKGVEAQTRRTPAMEKLIKAAKAQLAEFPDPDYGVLYWHPENRVVHWVAGDGAGGWTEAEKRFDLPGVQKVVAADEYFPSRKESGWKRLYG